MQLFDSIHRCVNQLGLNGMTHITKDDTSPKMTHLTHHSLTCLIHSAAPKMKGTEVPNPRRSRLSHACHTHSVLFLPMHSLLKGFRLSHACFVHCFVPALYKVRSRVSDALSQTLCNLSLAFLADFTLSDSTDLIRFIAFSRKLHSAFRLDGKT